ncbi:serine hydrolase [Erythrobacter sp. 3-20A1M]|uniref:serine hydrolase n=1 Tax=Erythrobacter sp. 3-20A1M TaxID=2653850 RepID=UPI001BFC5354|nr:serine hydrolase [Erythrobacter sp. 3-20A1M]QWC55909.1 serine hydrolase [Erythrobacter sp. 3-20A1M]
MNRFALGLAALVAIAAPAHAQSEADIARFADAESESGQFMGAVLVARDGTVLFDRGYGDADLEWNIANDGDTKFRIGSLTKQFTAVATLMLRDQGKLKLDAPVSTYLPDTPPAWAKVTVRNLLTHTSGIVNFTGLDAFDAEKARPTAEGEPIALFRDLPLEFEPGSKYDYSNSNYIVLTRIVERLSGRPYADFVHENLFQPAGMTDTAYDDQSAIVMHRASGYAPGPDGPLNAPYADMSWPLGAGGLYSTTRDLLKWERALFGGKLLPAASMKDLLTVARDDYALGLLVQREGEATTISHSGGIEGFNSWLGYDPDRKVTVAVLANLNGPAASRLGTSLMKLAQGREATPVTVRNEVAVSAETLDEYPGTYRLAPTFAITIRREGDHLMAQATGQPEFQLYAEKTDRFFLKVVDAVVEFTRDDSGKVTGLTLFQNGQEMPARRE